MQTFLTTHSGARFELPTLLSWSFSYGDSLPCDAFEVSFVYDASMYEMLLGAVRFSAVFEGETVFSGVVDEFVVSLGEKGKLVTVCGRSLAALLLDNEAEAAELYGAGLDYILEKYVYPFGVKEVRKNVSPPPRQLVVASGSSCWKVLEEFLWLGCGQAPRFSPDGVLVLGAEEGRRFEIDKNTAVFEQVLKSNRYGVISSVLVKNKVLGASTLVENREFLDRGGSCRRVLNVPRYTRYDAMRSTADYQIKASKKEEFSLSLTVSGQFAAFPGDVIELRESGTGVSGAFVVGRTRVFATAEKMGTEIVLTGREG
ncbi:MAG: hypothetical protein LBM18_00830 [Oscillospiraceae bacterium]|jgi:prophage tail gpP-like protein|nr:hypothetical protein [Oscillospiraceae bacterium]